MMGTISRAVIETMEFLGITLSIMTFLVSATVLYKFFKWKKKENDDITKAKEEIAEEKGRQDEKNKAMRKDIDGIGVKFSDHLKDTDEKDLKGEARWNDLDRKVTRILTIIRIKLGDEGSKK